MSVSWSCFGRFFFPRYLVLLKVIFYFHPYLGAFWGLCFIFFRFLKQIQVYTPPKKKVSYGPKCGQKDGNIKKMGQNKKNMAKKARRNQKHKLWPKKQKKKCQKGVWTEKNKQNGQNGVLDQVASRFQGQG